MERRLKYFIMNKKSDYERGFLENMVLKHGGICTAGDSQKKGVFISRILDSQETETAWHRLKLCREGQRESPFCLTVYSGNQKRFVYEEKEMDLEEFIRRSDISLEDKKERMAPWMQKQVVGLEDILLHEVRGRYLWIMIEMYWQHEENCLFDIQIYFPRQSWIEYLPEIYQKEDSHGFLERYLGIFQTIYEDLEEKICSIPDNFDMEMAKEEYLGWLAGWLDIEDSYVWSPGQLRELLRNGVLLYKKRGTRQGIMDFVTLYSGEAPFIVENHQLQYFRKQRTRFEKLCRLYGNNAYTFTVLVREKTVQTLWQQKTLIKIIEEVKPAQMALNLVVLKPYIFLDQYSYLGINSVLGKYTNVTLDGCTVLPFAVLETEVR